jgi:hypothetical protein
MRTKVHITSTFALGQEAEEPLLTLRAEVMASPDLTEEDRLIAIGVYDVAYALYEQPLLAKVGSLATGVIEPAQANVQNFAS